MRKLVVAVLMALLLWPSAAFASPIGDAIKDLEVSGKQSNAYVNHSVIDLVYLSSQGSVTAYTYMGINEDLTINNFSVLTQTPLEAHDKLTRFIFELTNRYRPDTDLALSGLGALPSVHAWTYGAMKDEAMWAIVYGIEECLNNPPYNWQDDDDDNDSSYIDRYSPKNIKITLATIFAVGNTTYTVSTTTTGTEAPTTTETRIMDTAPEIIDGRTFVPVRYVAYAVGVEEDDIKWDSTAQKVTIIKDETRVGFLIGQKYQYINDQPRLMDVTPYIKDGRTMLPARWVAEPFGAKVNWDEATQQVKIEITQEQG